MYVLHSFIPVEETGTVSAVMGTVVDLGTCSVPVKNPSVCGSPMGSALGGTTMPLMPRVHMQARKESQGTRAEVLIWAVA